MKKRATSNKEKKANGLNKTVPDSAVCWQRISQTVETLELKWLMESQSLDVAVQVCKDVRWDKDALTIFHIFSTEAHHINLYILPEGILSTCSLRETYRLNTIQSVAVIYIQNKEKNHICNANSMDVCLCAAWAAGTTCCFVFYTHVQSKKALWILISHFVISRYPGGEVCALECEESVCLNVTKRFSQRFAFFY